MTDARPTLTDELAAAAVAGVTGLVGSRSPGGAVNRDGTVRLSNTLSAWRQDGGPVRTDPLTVRTVAAGEAKARFDQFFARNRLVRFAARVAVENRVGTPQADLVEYGGAVNAADDPDLAAALVEQTRPRRSDDPRFGRFTLDPYSRDEWDAEVTLAGRPVRLSLPGTPEAVDPAALAAAKAVWEDEAEWAARVADRAVADLLALAEEWRDEGDPPIPEADFRRRVRPDAVGFEPDGRFEVWCDADDIFSDHAVVVRGTVADGPRAADIA